MSTKDTQPSLPPAPEGFAWMPCDLRGGTAPEGQDHAWYHQILGWQMVEHVQGAGTWNAAARLIRRLGPCEDPGKIEGARLLPGTRWDYHAPVRFVPGQAPDFGAKGLRFVDDWEDLPPRSVCRWQDPGTGMFYDEEELEREDPSELFRVCAPITLPPLRGDS